MLQAIIEGRCQWVMCKRRGGWAMRLISSAPSAASVSLCAGTRGAREPSASVAMCSIRRGRGATQGDGPSSIISTRRSRTPGRSSSDPPRSDDLDRVAGPYLAFRTDSSCTILRDSLSPLGGAARWKSGRLQQPWIRGDVRGGGWDAPRRSGPKRRWQGLDAGRSRCGHIGLIRIAGGAGGPAVRGCGDSADLCGLSVVDSAVQAGLDAQCGMCWTRRGAGVAL